MLCYDRMLLKLKRELDKSCDETLSEPDMSAKAEMDHDDDMGDRK